MKVAAFRAGNICDRDRPWQANGNAAYEQDATNKTGRATYGRYKTWCNGTVMSSILSKY
jgi:hypothetical protein